MTVVGFDWLKIALYILDDDGLLATMAYTP